MRADIDGEAVDPDAITSSESATDADSVAQSTAATVDRALDAFRRGEPVCIHDFADREGETDIIYPATAIDAAAVAHMRNDAGGLVCLAVADHVADAFGLPFLADAIDHPAVNDTPAYDDRSSFSLPVNHRDTFTGITDDDRALTISAIADAAAAVDADPTGYSPESFASEFRSPGHVHLLRGAQNGIDDRVGHTELGLALAAAVDEAPAVVVCEMLDDATGAALTPADAEAYARRHGIPYVEGAALVDALQ